MLTFDPPELEERIKRGDWKPHQQLPTEDELGEVYAVSKATVRQALRELAQDWLEQNELQPAQPLH